jgi:carbon-monoxide dehydrogenase large subunit
MTTESHEQAAYVGRRLKRVEDPRLIQGRASYVDDLRLHGTLHAAILRSPYPHAMIRSVDAEAARAMPGVVGIFTAADVNEFCGTVPTALAPPDLRAKPQKALAEDRVFFVGHPVAVVVARDRAAAVDALLAIDVEYDPLPAVSDPEAALEPGAPLVHPDLGSNVAFTHTHSVGDVEAAFAAADRVITQSIRNQRLTPLPLEPRGCVASWNAGEESVTLWASTQIPHIARTLLAGMIGVPENRIRVIAPEVGGGFGAKLNLYVEEALCCHLARRLGAPVKWIEGRRENMAATIHGRDQRGVYELAVKDDGTLLAIRAKTIADIGSYCQLFTPAIPMFTGLMLPGCYKLQAVHMDVTGVFTNKMATDAYRGAGRPEATYQIERLVDIVADELGLDPVKVRRKNFPAAEEFPYQTAAGLVYDSGDYHGALEKAREAVGWEDLLAVRDAARAEGRLFGVGVSTYVEICAMGPSAAMPAGGWEWGSVRLEMTGKVTAITGVSPHGQGQQTAFSQLLADRLGVPIEDVVVLHGDTAIASYGRDTYGSRGTSMGGSALVMSIDKVLEKARRLAAHLLESPVEQVAFAGGRFTAEGGGSLSLAEVAGAAYVAKSLPHGMEPGLEASSFFEAGNFTFPFGCHIVAVEVDPETGETRIVKYAAVDDCGPQINPLLVEGQVQGGIAQGMGQALMEQTLYDEDGQLLTGELMDYAIPRATDIPEYLLDKTETPSPSNPLGIKGVGEAGTIGATPAIANAVIDALSPLGIRHLDLPLTPEKVWRAIRDAELPPLAVVRDRAVEPAVDAEATAAAAQGKG